ncbi:Palmitoyltransferase pfa5 [Elasticomyces elasticus]|nr:Palmitoyltransferase pfa5 [Elasticomyces elasticus]
MDHFCPWVGGVVGERSLKFFLQFLVYAMLLSTYLTAAMAFFVHETLHRNSNVHFYVALGIGAFFLLFTLGMVATSIQYAAVGWTTIEQAGRNDSIHLAVLLPPELQAALNGNMPNVPPAAVSNFTSEIDDLAHSSYFSNNTNWPLRRASRSEFGISVPPTVATLLSSAIDLLDPWPGERSLVASSTVSDGKY